jgi:hypothetical protein
LSHASPKMQICPVCQDSVQLRRNRCKSCHVMVGDCCMVESATGGLLGECVDCYPDSTDTPAIVFEARRLSQSISATERKMPIP